MVVYHGLLQYGGANEIACKWGLVLSRARQVTSTTILSSMVLCLCNDRFIIFNCHAWFINVSLVLWWITTTHAQSFKSRQNYMHHQEHSLGSWHNFIQLLTISQSVSIKILIHVNNFFSFFFPCGCWGTNQKVSIVLFTFQFITSISLERIFSM